MNRTIVVTAVTAVVVLASPLSRAAPPSPPTAPSTTSSATSSTGAPVAADDAASTEARAFVAIDGEQWCLAMRLFEKAHAQGPAVDLLLNASQAGEAGGDIESARRFSDEVAGLAEAPKAKKVEARKRTAQLVKRIATSGGGTPCPTLEELQPKAAVPSPEPSSSSSSPGPGPGPSPEEPPADLRTFGYVGAGLGGVAVVVGASTAAVGLLPWFAHAGAVSGIEAAEAQKADATALQEEQATARAGWESYGQALTVAGSVLTATGVVVVAAGLGLAFLSPAPVE